jgi:thymidine phosphorylase
MLPQEIIRRKRDGLPLSADDISSFVGGLVDGGVDDGQAAAFAMAVLLRGMNRAERVALTLGMMRSGQVLSWPDARGPVLDKHSTGGVGDKVSLILAPLVAACGGLVPMISGRGLGHTGGTLDKMDSIPGYRSQPDLATLRNVVNDVGCAIVGATVDIAPADRRLYAIRDVTATVESIDLICASILSKKLAAGLQGLVLDVKTGSGSFLADDDRTRELAQTLVDVAEGAGLPTVAWLTDMNQVLGDTAGNALEVQESIELLTGGRRDVRLWQVTLTLGAEMLLQGRLAPDLPSARQKLEQALDCGAAADHFARMVAALGGPSDLLQRPYQYLPAAPVVLPVLPERPGVIVDMQVRDLGIAVVELGGGRRTPTGRIDPAVGLSAMAGPGDEVGPDRPLCLVHARTADAAAMAAAQIRKAIRVADPDDPLPANRPTVRNPVAGRIAAQ